MRCALVIPAALLGRESRYSDGEHRVTQESEEFLKAVKWMVSRSSLVKDPVNDGHWSSSGSQKR